VGEEKSGEEAGGRERSSAHGETMQQLEQDDNWFVGLAQGRRIQSPTESFGPQAFGLRERGSVPPGRWARGGRICIAEPGFGCLFGRVKGSRVFLWYWLPVMLWLGLITAGSSDLMSSKRTSRIIGPVLRWLVPEISEATVQAVQLVVRKTAHVTEYAVLTLLIWRACRKPVRRDSRPWDWKLAGRAFLLAVLCAALDEFHQSFVPSREGTVRDVLFDTSGALIAVGLLRLGSRWASRE
jgi:VanZ family protein